MMIHTSIFENFLIQNPNTLFGSAVFLHSMQNTSTIVVVNQWLILFTLKCCCLHLGHEQSNRCNESENHIKQQNINETENENEMMEMTESRISQKTPMSFWQIKDYRKQHTISEQVLFCVSAEKSVMHRNVLVYSIAGEEIKYIYIN